MSAILNCYKYFSMRRSRVLFTWWILNTWFACVTHFRGFCPLICSFTGYLLRIHAIKQHAFLCFVAVTDYPYEDILSMQQTIWSAFLARTFQHVVSLKHLRNSGWGLYICSAGLNKEIVLFADLDKLKCSSWWEFLLGELNSLFEQQKWILFLEGKR